MAPDAEARTVFILCNHVGTPHARRANRKLARLVNVGDRWETIYYEPAGGAGTVRLGCADCGVEVVVTEADLRELAVRFHDAGVLPILLADLVDVTRPAQP